MARVEYADLVVNNRGIPQSGVTVSVVPVAGSSGTPKLWRAETGEAQLTGVVTGPNGTFSVWLDEGRYDITPAGAVSKRVELTGNQSVGSPGSVNVKDYGALGNGVADDTAAMMLAIAALGKSGTLVVPGGIYLTDENLPFDATQGVVVQGGGGISANGGATIIKLMSGTAPSVMSARSSIGFSLQDITLGYSNAAFKGVVLDLSATGTPGEAAGRGEDTGLATLSKSFITSFGKLTSATVGVLLDNSYSVKVRDCNIGGAEVGVLGRSSKDTHANGVAFSGTAFVGNTVAHTKNAGGAWTYDDGCIFEGAVAHAPFAYTYDAGVIAHGTSFTGCWFGDAGAGQKQIQIDWVGSGLTVEGNFIGGQKEAGSIGVRLSGNGSHGIIVRGNYFVALGVAVACPAEGLAFLDLTGNDYVNVTTQVEEPGTGFAGYAILPGSGSGALRYLNANLQVSTLGKGLWVKEGANAKQGVSASMVAGEVTVANTAIGASSRLLLTRQAGGTHPGAVYESERVAGEKFVVTSTNAEDTGTVAYEIFEAAE